MTVAQSITFFVANCFEELVDPDRRIYCETFAIQCLDLDRPSAGLHDRPEARNTHDSEFKGVIIAALRQRQVYVNRYVLPKDKRVQFRSDIISSRRHVHREVHLGSTTHSLWKYGFL